MRDTPGRTSEVDWAAQWKSLVAERSAAAGAHGDTAYWDRRAPSFARSTRARADEFLDVVTPYLSPRKTLIDVGAGAGRHALPLADRLEWVTAIEPSEGMRALIGEGWDEDKARAILRDVLVEEGGELVFNGGLTLSGIAHWQPRTA